MPGNMQLAADKLQHFHHLIPELVPLNMKEVVIDVVYLRGRRDEIIVKELSLAAEDVILTFHFQSPYQMEPHGSEANGVSWDDGHIQYYTLHTVVDEAVAGYPTSIVLGSKSVISLTNCWVDLYIIWKI
jgi:hypothetical protein